MRYGSVCSGIEAATVAWHPLGWKPAFFSEIDPFPSAVLAHHHPEVKNYGDFTNLIDSAHPVHSEPPIDLLVGGTPCQAFSVAGLRQGLADPRGGLTLEFLRLARALRPRWVLWENVPGVLSQDGGRAFGAFLAGLEDLGYGWAYRVLDAQYTRVDGYPGAVPQRRKRVFVVGHSGGDFSRAAAVLFEPEGVRRDSPPRRAPRKGSSSDAQISVGFGVDAYNHEVTGDFASALSTKSCHLRSLHASEIMASGQANAPVTSDGTCPTLTCLHEAPIAALSFYPEVADVCGTIADGAHHGGGLNGQDAYTGRILPVAFDTTQITSATNRSNPKAGDPCHPPAAGAHPPTIAFDARQSDTLVYGDKTGPLDTDGHTIGVCVTAAVRRLTPGEVRLGEVMGTLNTNTNASGRNTPLAMHPVAANHWDGDYAHPTLNQAHNTGGIGQSNQELFSQRGGGLVGAMAVRRLTPVECERLQGFPDDYTRIPWKKKSAEECPDGGRYKALGNSMAVNCMRWIGRRIEMVEACDAR